MYNEVAIVGLGAAGAFAARQLASAGTSVIGLEAETLIHSGAAYAGESRLFRAAYHEGAEYVPWLIESREEWLRVESAGSRSLFLETGVLSIGSATAPQMSQVAASLEKEDLPHEVFTADQLRQRYPQHAEITDEIAVLDLLGGVLRPEAAVSEFQRQATAAGADLRGGHRVTRIDEKGDHVLLFIENGETITAERVVVTAGVHTGSLVPELAAHLSIRPISLTWFCPEDQSAFAPDQFPAFIRDFEDIHLFGVPTLDGSLVKAGYDARFGSIAEPADLPSSLTREQRHQIATDVHRLIPGLPPQVARESLHMDVFTPDKRPFLGCMSERIVVGTGFSGHGFKLSPAFGNALAAFALGREPRHDVAPFSPLRDFA